MIRRFVYFVFIVGVMSTAVADESFTNDYDALCLLVKEAMVLKMEPNGRQTYIRNHLNSRVNSKDVKEAFELVIQVNPEKRYQVFKNAVESELNKNWDCPALEAYLNN
ncbi:MAG: hypothetical protein QM500_05120 [Methylococcales bacterium]